MRAICPTCGTAYTIPDDRIGSTGRKVRCAKCGESWRVLLPAAATAVELDTRPAAPAPRIAPVAEAVDDDFDVFDRPSDPSPPEASPVEPEHEPEPVREPTPTIAAHPAPPVTIQARNEPTPSMPIGSAEVRIRVKPRRLLEPLHLPKMPLALTRATPFFGPLVFVSALLVIAGLMVFRNAIVATAPGLAGFYATLGLDVNLRGLTFGTIQTLREIDNGQPVLVVEGSLSNPTQKPRDVPALRFALRDGDSQELYAWSIDPKATFIAAGDSLRFRTRLVAPPDRASDLQVRFVERRNQHAGLP